jgi:hypothetical protein
MAFTAGELTNIANAAMDYFVKGKAFAQSIQEKPLLNAMIAKQETFPGGKGKISIPVQFDYDQSSFAGYTHNDTVAYTNPANLKRAEFPWKEIHAGISLTNTELKHDGISVVDTLHGKSTSNHSERDVTVLTGLLENKLSDMAEAWSRSFDTMLHKDGTQDAKQVPGIASLITSDAVTGLAPTTGVIGGIDRATVPLWRNRSATGAAKITASAANQTLTTFLRKELRQLKRYGGSPDLVICGSAFIEALELEIAEKGIYTQQGFARGTNDIGMADITMAGLGRFIYDPSLDDLAKSKFAYFIDTKNVKLKVMEGEDRKTHNPARPADQYVLYRAMTWTGGLVARQLNGCGVYEVA